MPKDIFINMLSTSKGLMLRAGFVGRNLVLADAAFSIAGNCR